jgi:hypothetical protein
MHIDSFVFEIEDGSWSTATFVDHRHRVPTLKGVHIASDSAIQSTIDQSRSVAPAATGGVIRILPRRQREL